MTFLQWFEYDGSIEDLIAMLREKLALIGDKQGIVADQKQFGPVTVSEVSCPSELLVAHNAAVTAVSELGGRHMNPQWIGNGYSPHITHQASGKPTVGQQINFWKLGIVKRRSGSRREVVADIALR